MTLIVALEGTDGIVLASDSREATLDGFYNDNSEQKLHKISDNIGLLTSGEASLPITLIELFKKKVNDEPVLKDNITQAAEQFRLILLGSYMQWFNIVIANNPIKPDILFILTGYDVLPDRKEKKTFVLHSAMNFAPQPQIIGYATGGQDRPARVIISRLYSKDKNVEDLTKLAVYAITEAARTNYWVGGKVRVLLLKENETKLLTDAEVKIIIARNKRKGKNIETTFYRG
jgi:20S proteasome alpha/beta subunit